MPPYTGFLEAYDDDSAYIVELPIITTKSEESTTKQQQPQRRGNHHRVRFAVERNRVHVYPGVAEKYHNDVWYTAEEEHAFLQEAVLRHHPNDGTAAEPMVLSRALLLGTLVVQGVVLRALLLGHTIAAHI